MKGSKKKTGFLSELAKRPVLTTSHKKFTWKKTENGLPKRKQETVKALSKNIAGKGMKPNKSKLTDEHKQVRKFRKD